jgi:hypothetical protein
LLTNIIIAYIFLEDLGEIPSDVETNTNGMPIFKIALLIDQSKDLRSIAVQAALKAQEIATALDYVSYLDVQFVVSDNEGKSDKALSLAREQINDGAYAVITGKNKKIIKNKSVHQSRSKTFLKQN